MTDPRVEPTEMPIIQAIPTEIAPMLQAFLKKGFAVAGGFPLWLIGGASFYSDVDLYAFNWIDFYTTHAYFRLMTSTIQHTPETSQFTVNGTVWQLVKPARLQPDAFSLLRTSDLSPSACVLVMRSDRPVVYALYPEDIQTRLCRVLIRHDWSDFRTEVYQRKGYVIVEQSHIL